MGVFSAIQGAVADVRRLASRVQIVRWPVVESCDDPDDDEHSFVVRVHYPRFESLGSWPPTAKEDWQRIYSHRWLVGWLELRVFTMSQEERRVAP